MKKILSLASICVIISACGFNPIYGTKHKNVTNTLSHIEISNIADRSGQILRNDLIDRFYSNGRPNDISYILDVAPIEENIVDLDITKSSDATRAQLHLKTKINLKDTRSGEVILSRNISAISSYNVLTSEFATRVSAQNTRENAINDLARQIELQIGLYLNR